MFGGRYYSGGFLPRRGAWLPVLMILSLVNLYPVEETIRLKKYRIHEYY